MTDTNWEMTETEIPSTAGIVFDLTISQIDASDT